MNADEVWRLMTRETQILDTLTGNEPLPVWAALDMVQEETGGNRDDAVYALLKAAARWLRRKQPSPIDGQHFHRDASSLLKHLEERDLDRAGGVACCLENEASNAGAGRLAGTVLTANVMAFEKWRLWGREADKTVTWCRQVLRAQ